MKKEQLEILKDILKAFDQCVLKKDVAIGDVIQFSTRLQLFGKVVSDLEAELSKPLAPIEPKVVLSSPELIAERGKAIKGK